MSIPEYHLTQPGAVWITPWHVPVWQSRDVMEDREDRYALTWSRPRHAEPRVRHIAVLRDGDGWRAVSWGSGWKSGRVATRDDARAVAEAFLEELAR